MQDAAQAAFADAQSNFTNIFTQDSLRNVTGVFNFVKEKAEETQKAFDRKWALIETMAQIAEQGGGAKQASAFTDIGQGLQIDLARTVLGSLGMGKREQVVKDPQLAETNELLREVIKRLAGGLLTVG